jgi:5-carboxyvanillate decarboxylase
LNPYIDERFKYVALFREGGLMKNNKAIGTKKGFAGVGIPMSDPNQPMKPPAKVPYKRIATEEAWVTPEIMQGFRDLVAKKAGDAGFLSLWGVFIDKGGILIDRLLDMGENRIKDMDATGIDVQLLLLTAPGVQVFSKDKARSLAADSNNQLAEAIRKYPDRFAGLAAVAPQDPGAAAKELERCLKLGLKGAVVNSHTKGEYLDDPKFWEIFEAAESLNVPIYIHPQTPSPDMVMPFVRRGLDTAIMGFGVEVALHTLGIITSGALDRFPDLKIVIGHGGEGLPYWLYRIDYMQEYNRQAFMPKLEMLPSDYMKRNIYITTSGLPWAPAITMAQSVLGMDRVLYAMDYPYQYRVEEVTMTDNFPISDANKKKLFQKNSEEVFSL